MYAKPRGKRFGQKETGIKDREARARTVTLSAQATRTYNTIQYNTIQYNTIQWNTKQYKFIQEVDEKIKK